MSNSGIFCCVEHEGVGVGREDGDLDPESLVCLRVFAITRNCAGFVRNTYDVIDAP